VSLPFVLRMAAREGRASLRRLGVLAGAVAAGVGALVAINGFTESLQASVRAQARALLGADLAFGSAYPFSDAARTRLAALQEEGGGGRRARVARFAAMAFLPRNSATRLSQVVASEPGYPFYGTIRTDPPGLWGALGPEDALLDPALLSALEARRGDTLALGEGRFTVRGVVTEVPGDVALRSALGPRIYVAFAAVEGTKLLTFGSRARHEEYLQLADAAQAPRLAARHRAALAAERVSLRTVSEDQESVNDGYGRLGQYLGLVALVALLLGGVGVASAVHVLIKRRWESIAVLRCLGAGAREVMAVYLLQAGALGLLGGVAGAAGGVLLQMALPQVVGEFLPVDVDFAVSWRAVALGVALGLWVALVFALLPLLAVRRIAPLAALRRPYEEAPARGDRARLLAGAALVASVTLLSVQQAPSVAQGVIFAAAVVAVLAICALAARGLVALVRRYGPRGGPYVWRQGLANLHRPANQTVTVVLALGFGVFLLETVFAVQGNLLRDLRVDARPDRPNVVFFDIQPEQRARVEGDVRAAGHAPEPAVPIVPMRIHALKGVPASAFLATSAGRRGPGPAGPGPAAWAVRREYRSTYRDLGVSSETTVEGRLWSPGAGRGIEGPVPVSIEEDVARELGVALGDAITWDVQGRLLESRVVHVRRVDWGRFEPNFFVVFPEGPLDGAPRSYVTMARIGAPDERTRLFASLARAFPNVTAVDLTQVQQAVERVVSRMALAVRFMAAFTLLAGGAVLVGAVAASRHQRVHESVLLRTLGATRAQVLRILLAEYAALGTLAGLAALVLAASASWALVRFVFESPFTLPLPGLAVLSAGAALATVVVGLLGSREVLSRPPLEVLRSE
jgi:putative ABC transport system permease protein